MHILEKNSEDILRRNLWLTFVIPLAALLLHAFYYYPFFVDDAFISLRYADRLLHGLGLTWNDGEHVEGYSNLLWVLLTADLGGMGFDLVAAGRVVCILSSIATLLALVYHHGRIAPKDAPVLLFSSLAFALTAPVAIWTVGGLEGTLTMALLAWSYVLAVRLLEEPKRRWVCVTGALLGFVAISRPEGAFFTMAIAAALLLFVSYPRRQLIRPLLWMCIIPFLFFAAQVAFRLSYYGEWLPNTYYAKVAMTYARLVNGLFYSIKSMASFLPLLLIVALYSDRLIKDAANARARRVVAFCITVTIMWLVPLTLAGGDMEPGYRHILLILPLLIIMLMECLTIAYASGSRRSTHIFCGYLLVCFFWLQCVFDENIQAKDETWEWKVAELGQWLGKHYGSTQPLIAVSNSGAIPYYSHLPSLDMYGINDGYLTKHRGKQFGHGFLGHELFNRDYLMSRAPDMVIFFTGRKKAVMGADLDHDEEFLRLYEQRQIDLPDYSPIVWVRKDSGKVK